MALYEQRINDHRFETVAALIAEDAIFWFNDGSYHGLAEIRRAFEAIWSSLKDETYWLENLQWLAVGDRPRPASIGFDGEQRLMESPGPATAAELRCWQRVRTAGISCTNI